MTYQFTSPYVRSLRPIHSVDSEKIRDLLAGQIATGDEIWTETVNTAYSHVGDKWLRVLSVDGVAVTRETWVAYIHKSISQGTLTESGAPPAGGTTINFAVVNYTDATGTHDVTLYPE